MEMVVVMLALALLVGLYLKSRQSDSSTMTAYASTKAEERKHADSLDHAMQS